MVSRLVKRTGDWQTAYLGTIGVYLITSVVEPKDALRSIFDGNVVALALTKNRQRQTHQDIERHFLLADPFDLRFRAAHSSSIPSSITSTAQIISLHAKQRQSDDSRLFTRPVAPLCFINYAGVIGDRDADMNLREQN